MKPTLEALIQQNPPPTDLPDDTPYIYAPTYTNSNTVNYRNSNVINLAQDGSSIVNVQSDSADEVGITKPVPIEDTCKCVCVLPEVPIIIRDNVSEK